MRSRTLLPGFLLLLMLAFLAGCQRAEIRSYTVKRLKTDRTLAALVPVGTTAWFFKLTGANGTVAEREQDFRSLLNSIQIVGDDEPQWTVPQDWVEKDGTGMRVKTLEYEQDGRTLEITVIKLEVGETPTSDYVLQNVNRWRGELQLEPIQLSDLAKETESLQVGEVTATLVNLLGLRDLQRRPPFMDTSPPAPGNGSAGATASVTYNTPDGWEPSTLNQFRKAAFIVHEGDQQVEITIIDLAAQAGELLPNINRWRGQVGLSEIDQQQMESELQETTLGDVSGYYVKLQSSQGAEKQQTILGVIAVRQGSSWFVKLTGDTPLAERENENFLEFVSSIKFTR